MLQIYKSQVLCLFYSSILVKISFIHFKLHEVFCRVMIYYFPNFDFIKRIICNHKRTFTGFISKFYLRPNFFLFSIEALNRQNWISVLMCSNLSVLAVPNPLVVRHQPMRGEPPTMGARHQCMVAHVLPCTALRHRSTTAHVHRTMGAWRRHMTPGIGHLVGVPAHGTHQIPHPGKT